MGTKISFCARTAAMLPNIPRPGTGVWSCVWSAAANIAVAVCVRELRGCLCNSRHRQKNKGAKIPLLLMGLNSPNEVRPGQGRQVIYFAVLYRKKNCLAGAAFTLDHSRNKKSLGSGAWKALHLPCSRALGGESGMTRAKPLVLQKGSLPGGPKQIKRAFCLIWFGERSE